MKKTPAPSCTSRNGFTILELAVTVIIIAIICVVALSQYKKSIERSRSSEAKVYLDNVAKAQEAFFLGNNYYTPEFEQLDIDVTREVY